MKESPKNVISSEQWKVHQWAATGVSGYPLTHPIVGQGQFYETFRQFIHIVDAEQEGFAHVFAVVAPWGVGKSRLGYELIGQINDASKGWHVRDEAGDLKEAQLFYDENDRSQYLGLYLRYSQIANEYQNVDNWFGYGLYKALLPLTRESFDGSIQGQIARQAYDRLFVLGFEASKLADALEVAAGHSDEALYEDPQLVTRLCEAAYRYLSQFGIRYLLIVLDELETAAEAATFGLEREELTYLDGRAIKLLGKAIKEEDPRRKLPWLRYVALCSPAIGDELRELQSTARRFELVDLTPNSFSDVSDFVEQLRAAGRLPQQYLPGLVEAAYTMGAGNFGWFNVIMANVDGVLRDPNLQGKNAPATIGELFDNAVRASNRLREHVLDHNALGELKLAKAHLPAARDLLYGQLPVPLKTFTAEQREALLNARNEFDEPIATLYTRVEWEEKACSDALRSAKAKREKGRWLLPGVDEPLDLRQLLANLSTYAIHETQGKVSQPGRHTLLVPQTLSDFVQLVAMLYPHPGSEDAARALWASLVAEDRLPSSGAGFVGPSVAMLGRLNLRYRKQTHNALIFRDPDDSAALERALEEAKGQKDEDRARQILTGLMRALDDHWDYEPVSPALKTNVPAIVTLSGKGKDRGGLLRFDALKLHPEGRVILAYVRSEDELTQLCEAAASQFADEGRTPVLAFTSSRHLADRFASAPTKTLKDAQEYLLLYWLNQNEEQILQQIGLPRSLAKQLVYRPERFTTPFSNRLQSLLRSLKAEVHRWRRKLNGAGRIAWPFRPGGPMTEEDRTLVIEAWRKLLVEPAQPRKLEDLDPKDGLSPQDVLSALRKMAVSPKAVSAGYQEDERAGLFDPLNDSAEPRVPAFFVSVIDRLLRGADWTYGDAKKEWFWGYVWEGSRPQDTFEQWMVLACRNGYAEAVAGTGKTDKRYRLVERQKIRNSIQEASNWLNGKYPDIVAKMEQVFGEGKVLDYFGPLSLKKPGSKTIDARNKLDAAKKLLDELDVLEAAPDRDISKLVRSAQLRIKACGMVGLVYDADEYQRLKSDENLKTLNFEDDTRPLWERIRRAEIFADNALALKDRIIEQIDVVASAMSSEVKQWPRFPIALFTRSLNKIQNILTGALEVKEPVGTTQNLQSTEAGTLKQSLRDLKIAEALSKLQQLAREVGLDGVGGTALKLDEMDGQIATGFRELRKGYQSLHDRLNAYTQQLDQLARELKDVPDDFSYPKDLPPFAELVKHPAAIRSELEEAIFDDIETLFDQHDRAAQLGNFQPLMTAAKDLLKGPAVALNKLGGYIVTLENQARDYRARLLRDTELTQTEKALNDLRATRGLAPYKTLDAADLEAAGSLKAAKQLVQDRRGEWATEGEKLLAQTGVTFTRWRTIITALDAKQDPELGQEEADELVMKGFLRRTYTLGGPVA